MRGQNDAWLQRPTTWSLNSSAIFTAKIIKELQIFIDP